MKLCLFLVVAGLQWCFSTQESWLFLTTRRPSLHASREGGYRGERRLSSPSDREQTNFRKHSLPSAKPDREIQRATERHGVTKREVTAEEIIRKLPRVYEPGSATRYSYPSENFRSLVDQTYLLESNSNVAGEKSDAEANEYPRNSTIAQGGTKEAEISAIDAFTEQVKSTTAIPKAPASGSENSGYDFLLKQLQKFMKKSSNKTVNAENSPLKLPYETNSTVRESHEGNSTDPVLHKSNEFENQTHSVSITANLNKPRPSNKTSKNQSMLETDAEQYDDVGSSLTEGDDKFAELLQPEASSPGRGRPRIILPDTSTLHLEATGGPQDAGSGTRKSHPIFKIKDPLIYSNSDQISAKFNQIISDNISSNTTNSVTNKSPDVNVSTNSTIVQASTKNLTNNEQSHASSDNPDNTVKISTSSNVTTDQPEAVNENNEPNASPDSITSQDLKVISLVVNSSLEVNTSNDDEGITEEIKNKTSVLQKTFLKAENQSLPFKSGHPELIQNILNPELNQSTSLQNETSLESPLHFLSQNFTGSLHNVPVSPARLLPQNILGYNFNPSKPFSVHSPHTPTSPFSSGSSGLLGFDSLRLGPWNPPSYLPNAGNADFTSSQHFSASNLGLPSSLGRSPISPTPSTLGGVDIGGLDFLSLLSSLGGFNSPSVPSAVGLDFSSPGRGNSPYSIGGASQSFQSTPLNQLLLKRFGVPEELAAGKTFESTAAAGVHGSYSAKTSI